MRRTPWLVVLIFLVIPVVHWQQPGSPSPAERRSKCVWSILSHRVAPRWVKPSPSRPTKMSSSTVGSSSQKMRLDKGRSPQRSVRAGTVTPETLE